MISGRDICLEHRRGDQDAKATSEQEVDSRGRIPFLRGKAALLGSASMSVQGAARGKGAKSFKMGFASTGFSEKRRSK